MSESITQEERRQRLQRIPAPRSAYRNISRLEQWVSLAAGAGLVIKGVTRGRLGGLVMTGLGLGCLQRGVTGHCHTYQALGINTASRNPANVIPYGQGHKVEKSVTINRPAEELFELWRDLERLPTIMRHLERVDVLDSRRSRWVARGPLNKRLEWEAEIINEEPGELIAWRSLPGGQVDTAGSVRFQSLPHGRGTLVRVSVSYVPPAGRLMAAATSLLGIGLEQEVAEDLARFKSMVEAGEIATIQGQPRGGC